MKTSLTTIIHLKIYRKLSCEKKFSLYNCIVSATFEGDIYQNIVISESKAETLLDNACSKFMGVELDVNTFKQEPTFENIIIALFKAIRQETFVIKKIKICKNETTIYEVSY